MSLFNLFNKPEDIAIDLGEANTVIVHNGKVIINEPTIVAKRGNKILAAGNKAKQWAESHNDGVQIVFPMSDGVLCDYFATEFLLKDLLTKAFGNCGSWGQKFNMTIVVPPFMTEVELCGIRTIARNVGGREVYMLFSPLANAIGLGIDPLNYDCNLIVDVGYSTTLVSIVAHGGIVNCISLRNGRNQLIEGFKKYWLDHFELKIDDDMVLECVKNINQAYLGVADIDRSNLLVRGKNCRSGLEEDHRIDYYGLNQGLNEWFHETATAISQFLYENSPKCKIMKRAYFAGSGPFLASLHEALPATYKIEEVGTPQLVAAKGAYFALKHKERYSFFIS